MSRQGHTDVRALLRTNGLTAGVTVAPGADTNSIIGANADLFTANAGYNQDLGIFVSDNGGTDMAEGEYSLMRPPAGRARSRQIVPRGATHRVACLLTAAMAS